MSSLSNLESKHISFGKFKQYLILKKYSLSKEKSICIDQSEFALRMVLIIFANALTELQSFSINND